MIISHTGILYQSINQVHTLKVIYIKSVVIDMYIEYTSVIYIYNIYTFIHIAHLNTSIYMQCYNLPIIMDLEKKKKKKE